MSGLWGGLWTPPERPADTSIETFLAELSLTPTDLSEQIHDQVFRHTFSHFHLDIEPIYLSLKREPLILRDAQQRWVAVDNLGDSEAAIGLSAAALKLVQQR